MNKEAIKNIAAAFEANPGTTTFFANEFGHCFTTSGEGLTAVSKEQNDADVAALGSEESTDPNNMTVAQLKAALTNLNIAFDAKATKASLIEALTAAQAK